MSRGLAVIALAAAACGAPPAAPQVRAPAPAAPAPAAAPETAAPAPAPDPLGIDWAALPYATDADALAIWARLELDGDNFAERLALVPDQPPLREAMARALLREGNFACPAIAKRLTCDRDLLGFPELTAEHRLGDPCLRRELALWALGELDDEVLAGELVADAIALAGLPPPEEDLNRAILYRVADPSVRLQLLDAVERAGNEAIADDMLGSLSLTGLEEAARRHHIDGAVIALDVGESLDLYLDAVNDPALRAETRIHAARELGGYGASLAGNDPARASITTALERARVAADCTIAAAALQALAVVTGKPYQPSLGRAAKPAAYRRALCLALHGAGDADALWRRIAPDGVVVSHRHEDPYRVAQLWLEYPDEPDADKDGAPDVPEADPDGDGNPATWIEVEKLAPADLPFLDELRRALPACTAEPCKLPDQTVWFRLHWKKAKGTLRLHRLERHEIHGDC